MCFTSTGSILRASVYITLLQLWSASLTAQILQPDRLEIPLSRHEANFEVIPAQEDGLFLHRRISRLEEDFVELIKLDTSFTRQWQGYLRIDPKFELMGKRKQEDHLYLLFRHREIMRKDLKLFVVEQNSGTYVQHTIRNYIPFVPTDFLITGEGALVGGYVNNVPVVIFYQFKTGVAKILPGLLNEAGELTQIKVNENGAFDVLISARNIAGNRTIWIKHYDPEGTLLYQTPLKTDYNKHLIFARSVSAGGDNQLIAGTYGNRRSEYSKGIFIAAIDASGSQQIRYYNYGDLENFFKYMRVKREQRIKDRIERRRIKGKKIRFNYRFIVHEIVPYNDQFVMLGEAFYPKYVNNDPRFNTGMFFYPGRSGIMQNGRLFDGYHYTHAVVMGFDQRGKLLWDNSFEINDVKTFSLEQFVKLEFQSDKIALLYLFENKIRTKIIVGDKVIEGKTAEPIRTLSLDEVTRKERHSEDKSRLDYWYRDYFYAYGVQQILNREYGERRVFFLNKISYSNRNHQN
jgi:hypothetical protein